MTALAGCQSFYVIVGSSAGAESVLQFVVMNLITNMPTARVDAQAGGAFATPTIIHFGTVLQALRDSERSMVRDRHRCSSLGALWDQRRSVRR